MEARLKQTVLAIEQFRLLAVAIQPMVDELVDAAVAAGACRADVLRKLGLSGVVMAWATAARRRVLDEGNPDQLMVVQALDRELFG